MIARHRYGHYLRKSNESNQTWAITGNLLSAYANRAFDCRYPPRHTR